MLTTERMVLNCILSAKENEMNPIITSGATTPRNVVRLLQTLFTVLACASLVIGSVLISIICLGNGSISLPPFLTIDSVGTLSAKFVATIILLIPTLFFAWLFGAGALLLARRGVAAGLSLPVALGVYVGLYLCIVFVIPHVPAPTLIFVALLFALNGVALWLAWRFLTNTIRKTV
jgi:hypothetical protein